MRRVFNYDNMSESASVDKLSLNFFDNTISACGALFYRVKNGKVQLLLIKYVDSGWPRLDDFGGQIDLTDDSVLAAMIRETSEETNNVIDLSQYILNENTVYFYNRRCKYYFAVVRVDENSYNDTKIFGDKELKDDFGRYINWYNYNECKSKLAWRLCHCEELHRYLSSQVSS